MPFTGTPNISEAVEPVGERLLELRDVGDLGEHGLPPA
jgi:hypothetical protein